MTVSDIQDSPSAAAPPEPEVDSKSESEAAHPEPEVETTTEAEESPAESEVETTAEAQAAPADSEVETTTEADASPADPEIEVTTESIVEALLFATDSPLPAGKIAQLVGTKDAGEVKRRIEILNQRYAEVGASFRVEAIAKGYQMHTLPVYHRWVVKLHKSRAESRLSAAALETLAVVAYRQPVLRADIEAVRGVAVGDMLARLRDTSLIRIVGRAEEIGRPLLYGTTRRFLEVFGLERIEDLPEIDQSNPQTLPKLSAP